MKHIAKSLLFVLSAAALASCAFTTGGISVEPEGSEPAPSSSIDIGSKESIDSKAGSSQGGASSAEAGFEWPSEQIEDFLGLFDIEGVTIPSIALPSDAVAESYIDDDDYGTEIWIYCVDEGTPGQDAIEDAYKAIIDADSNFYCFNDDTYTYDDYGYCYSDNNDLVSVIFYTYKGYFSIEIIPAIEETPFEWPTEELAKFLSDCGISGVTIPSMELPSDTEYEIVLDDPDEGSYVEFLCYYEDGMETDYAAIIGADSGFYCANDDENPVDEYGYIYMDNADQVVVQFYSYYDFFFVLDIYPYDEDAGGDAEYTDGSYETVDGFPSSEVNAFLAWCELTTEVPSLDSSAEWTVYYFVNNSKYYTSVFATTEDAGTPGVDAIEDAYKAIVEAAGWENANDSTYTYEEYGYFYDKGDVELQFYTYDGAFTLCAYDL